MSNKRNASTPTGALDKDLRLANSFSVLEDLDDQWVNSQRRGRGRGQSRGSVEHQGQPLPKDQPQPLSGMDPEETTGHQKEHQTYSSVLQRRDSLVSQGSRGGRRPTNMGDRTIFVTPKPEGGMRDDIVIECQTINGKPFKGTVAYKEAKVAIFEEKLGYDKELLHSIRTSFNGCPVLRFKLNQQINIDDLISVERFELVRNIPMGNTTKTDIIACRVMGIRGMQSVPNFDTPGNDTRWVKIEGCEYSLEEEQIMDWLKLYGEPLSPICEDIHDDSDSDAQPIGNGTYSVKMKLSRDIPQFLPVYGRRIRFYYRGISKLCTQCFDKHNRRSCPNQKVPWINYVRDFMFNNEEIHEQLYGKWWDVVDKEFPGYFDKCDEQGPVETGVAAMKNTMENENSYPIQNSQDTRQKPRFAPKSTNPTDPTELSELSDLIARGLTLEEAKSYIESQNAQQNLKKRISSLEARLNSNYSRGSTTRSADQSKPKRGHGIRTGTSGTSTGRGGLSFN